MSIECAPLAALRTRNAKQLGEVWAALLRCSFFCTQLLDSACDSVCCSAGCIVIALQRHHGMLLIRLRGCAAGGGGRLALRRRFRLALLRAAGAETASLELQVDRLPHCLVPCGPARSLSSRHLVSPSLRLADGVPLHLVGRLDRLALSARDAGV